MSELLNCCTDELISIEPVDRDIVHKEGIWHKTSHVWLYDENGFVYFQVRADANKLYTSASGHVMANETPKQTACREAKEELGIDLKEENLLLLDITRWEFDSETKHDHAFAHIYLYKLPVDFKDFDVDINEVSDVVKVKARDILSVLLDLPFDYEQYDVRNQVLRHKKELLVMPGEIPVLKYGRILREITKRSKHEKENIKS